jgi:hypothetical protein
MMETYRKLVMDLPEVFYTDNIGGDRQFLEEVIPSLLKYVQPGVETREKLIQKKNDSFAGYNPISVPDDVTTVTLSCATDIDPVCQYITDDQVGNNNIYIVFDYEWIPAFGSALSVHTRISTDPQGVVLV